MGFSLPVIAKLLDHESLDTTERYAETDADMINQALWRNLKSHQALRLSAKSGDTLMKTLWQNSMV